MYSYIAFRWDSVNIAAGRRVEDFHSRLRHASRPWKCRVRSPGFTVFDVQPSRGGLTAYVLPGSSGVIFGRLFPVGASAAVQSDLGAAAAELVTSTAGASLIQNYWGSYVALIRHTDSGVCHVVRDCSGKLSCFRASVDDVDIVFSDVRDLEILGLKDFRVNWRYVTAFLLESQLQVRECGLDGIVEVLAGERVTFKQTSVTQETLWNPRSICQEDMIDDYASAADQLRRTTQACIDAWASSHTSILHLLSGGFDSAVVLGCLMRAPIRPHVTCLNRYGDRPSEDERAYARAAAARAEVPLIEHALDIGDRCFDDRLLSLPREVKPQITSLVTFFDTDLLNRMSCELGFECAWTGQGGDHLFFALRTSVGANDFFRRHGFDKQLWRIVVDASRLTGDSVWHVLRSMVAAKHDSEAWLELGGTRERCLVSRDAIPSNARAYVLHPWLTNTHGLPKGKIIQLHFLAELLNRHRPVAGLQHEDEHHPLLSQPLIELCLRIPIYLLVGGGRTRGLARDAFRDVLPPEIMDRKAKGETTNFMVTLFRRNQAFMREMLLEGILMKERILDRAALDSVLSPQRALRSEDLYPLMSCIAAEVFARAWTERRPTADASHGVAASTEGLALAR